MKVISERKTGSNGNSVSAQVFFEMVSDERPTDDQVAESQIRCDYHPAGYGGPHGIVREEQPDKTWKTTFWCYASCD